LANFVENTRHSYGYVCVFRLISKQKSCGISGSVYLFLIPYSFAIPKINDKLMLHPAFLQ
jgi:hypothetical protein